MLRLIFLILGIISSRCMVDASDVKSRADSTMINEEFAMNCADGKRLPPPPDNWNPCADVPSRLMHFAYTVWEKNGFPDQNYIDYHDWVIRRLVNSDPNYSIIYRVDDQYHPTEEIAGIMYETDKGFFSLSFLQNEKGGPFEPLLTYTSSIYDADDVECYIEI